MGAVRRWYPLMMILLATLAVRWPLAHAQFGRSGDGTGSFYGIVGRNYLDRPWGQSLWMPVISVPDDGGGPTVYAHHPPLMPMLTAASMWAFGDTDFAVRLPAMCFTLAAIGGLYAILLPISRVSAICAGVMMAFVPLTLRFGQMPDVVNAQLVFAGELIVLTFMHWLKRPGRSRMVGLIGALTFGFLTDWPAFYFVPMLGAYLLAGRKHRGVAIRLALFGAGVFAGYYVWTSLASHDWLRIVHQFLNRSARSATDNAESFTLSSWISGTWAFNSALHTWPLFLLSILGYGLVLPDGRRRAICLGPILLLAWAVMHVLIGRQGVLNHDWWWWPVTPALVAGGALLPAVLPGRLFRRAAVGVCFALPVWWVGREIPHEHSAAYQLEGVAFSPAELGEAIQEAAPPGRAVMLFQDEKQPYIVYYARRPVLQGIWDSAIFERRCAENRADLFYTFDQSTPAKPAGLVFPKVYAVHGEPFITYLRQRYPEREVGAFWVFDLDHGLVTNTQP